MKKFLVFLLIAMSVGGAGLGLATLFNVGPFSSNRTRDTEAAARASHPAWAEKLSLEGVENFHRVSAQLYRGEQGMLNLADMGIKTVVCLRTENYDEEMIRNLAKDSKLTYLHIPMYADEKPTDGQVVKFLAFFADAKNLPVFVHCRQGADRTGTMCAMYRIVVQGWSSSQALDEMTHGGFGYHKMFDVLTEYIRAADAKSLARQAGLTETKKH